MRETRYYVTMSAAERCLALDAMIRFRKNKSSMVAAVIIGLLMLYALFVPEKGRGRAALAAVCANAVSLVTGALLLSYLPI